MSFGVRVFDTVLDGRNIKDTFSRNAADFWRQYCKASGWSFSFERIHSLTDLSYFMNRTIKEDVILFSGHGHDNGWHMTNKEVLNEESIDQIVVNKNNTGKEIVFSSCLMGINGSLCNSIKTKFEAKRLFAYRHEMEDRFCYLNEAILLTLLEKKKNFTEKDFEKFKASTVFMKNLNKKGVKMHPMEMYHSS